MNTPPKRYTAYMCAADRPDRTRTGLTYQKALDIILNDICSRCKAENPEWETQWYITACGAEWNLLTDSYYYANLEPDAKKKAQWQQKHLTDMDRKIDTYTEPDRHGVREMFLQKACDFQWSQEEQQSILLLYIAQIQVGEEFEDFEIWLHNYTSNLYKIKHHNRHAL